MTAVATAAEQARINAQISFVFCSRDTGEAPETDMFFELIDSYGIPLQTLSYRDFKKANGKSPGETTGEQLPGWRLDYDRRVISLLEKYPVDICVLAGYMLIVGPEMCRRFAMLNLHPAQPGGPVGTWREVIWKLIDQKAERSGAMMHLVTPELDKGPVATYCTYPIKGGSFDKHWKELGSKAASVVKEDQGEAYTLFRLIRQHGAARELPLIVSTLKSFADGRVRISHGHVCDSSGNRVEGYDLSAEVDQSVRGSF